MNGCNGSRRTYNDASIAVYPLDDIQHSDSRFTIFVLSRCCQNPQWHILWQLVRQLGSIRLTMTMTTTTTGTTSTTHVSTDDWHLFPPFLQLPESTIATGELLVRNDNDMVARPALISRSNHDKRPETHPSSCHSFNFLFTPVDHQSQSSLFLGHELFLRVLMRHPSRSHNASLTVVAAVLRDGPAFGTKSGDIDELLDEAGVDVVSNGSRCR